jgi:ABC-type multidrug transport system permease subunit
MGFVWISAVKDFKRRLADPVAMAIWLGIPVLIGGLLGLVIDIGDGQTPRAKLLLVDQDDSLVTRLLKGAAGSGGEASMIELIPVELEEGRRRIDAGEASALLVVPEGFGAALLQETPVELRLVTNPAQRILPGILQEGLEILVEAAFHAQRAFGPELRLFAQGPAEGADFFPNAVVSEQATAINDKVQALDGVLFPPLLDFGVEVLSEEAQAPLSLGLLLFPGMLFLTMLFIAQGISSDLWEERESGTLRRVLTTPNGMRAFILGKVLTGALLIFMVAAVGLGLGGLAFGLPGAGLLPALLWGTLAGAALLPLFLFVQTLASSQQTGSVLSSMILFPLMMLGGSLLPFEAMPQWMNELGRWTPNGLGLVNFKALLEGRAEFAALARDLGLLLAIGGAFFVLTARRAAGRFVQA